MTVAELIHTLEMHPPGLRAMVQGYEDGYDDLGTGCVVESEASLNVYSEWNCIRHKQVLSPDKPTGHETVRSLFLRRTCHDDGGRDGRRS